MISAQFLWSMILSLVLIIRIIITLLTERTFTFIAFTLDYLKKVGSNAIFLCLIEYTAFEHWVKLIRKRIPKTNHDFLAGWLQIVNAILSLYLSYLQCFEAWNVEHFPSRKMK